MIQKHRGKGDNVGRDKVVYVFPSLSLGRLLLIITFFCFLLFAYQKFRSKLQKDIFPIDGFNILIVPFYSTCQKEGDIDISAELKIRLNQNIDTDKYNINIEILDKDIGPNFDQYDAELFISEYDADQVIFGFFCQDDLDKIDISYNWILADEWKLGGFELESNSIHSFKRISIGDVRSGKLQLNTTDLPINYIVGIVSMAKKEFNAARRNFLKLSSVLSDNIELQTFLAKSEIALGSYGNAEEILWGVIERDSSNLDALRSLSAIKIITQEIDSALVYTEKCISIDSTDYLSVYYSGLVKDAQKAPVFAKKLFEESFNLSGEKFVDALYMQGVMEEVIGNFDAAVKIYHYCMEIDDKYAPAYYELGHLYALSGHSDVAINYYKTCIKKDSTFVKAYANIGTEYCILEQLDSCEYYLKKGLELDAQDHILYGELGVLYLMKEMYDDAIVYTDSSLKYNSRYLPSLVNQASAYIAMEDYKSGLENLKRALSIDSTNYQANLLYLRCKTELSEPIDIHDSIIIDSTLISLVL